MKDDDVYCTMKIKCRTRESAEKVINPIFKKLVEGKYKDVEFETNVLVV